MILYFFTYDSVFSISWRIAFFIILTGCLSFHGHGEEELLPGKKVEDGIKNCPAAYVMDAMVDAHESVWIASEGKGVWRKKTGASPWECVTSLGFPEHIVNCYALAEDCQGRIWVGTDHEGVLVWNGSSWRQYTQVDGPIGERIFDIEVNRNNGMVALATSGGLTLYDPMKESWTDLTRKDGLYSDQVNSITFDREGTMYIGYQCGGVGLSLEKSRYRKWALEQSRWFWDKQQKVRQPGEPNGFGLPSNLCNDIACSGKAVWLATSSGVARREARQWVFQRGQDYHAKNKGVFGKFPKDRYMAPMLQASPVPAVMPEDYATSVYPCKEGIWIGFRTCGAVLLDGETLQIKKRALQSHKKDACRWVTGFVSIPSGDVYATTYGAGLFKVGTTLKWSRNVSLPSAPISHPHPRPPLSASMIKKLVQDTAVFPKENVLPKAVFWFEDWSTRGDWCQRYGRRYAILCAANAPKGNVVFQFDEKRKGRDFDYEVRGIMGPHKGKKDGLRHWVHWVNTPENTNVLYCPYDATRTEAEWDDHGEAYEASFDGPDVWALVRVPQGPHVMALYFFNPNGKIGKNGYRDFLVEVRDGTSLMKKIHRRGLASKPLLRQVVEQDLEEVYSDPVLARTRVLSMSGSGVYKNFVLQGPGTFLVKVTRNHSFNTILNGVFLSKWHEDGTPEKNLCYTSVGRYSDHYPDLPDLSTCDLSSLPLEAVKLWSVTLEKASSCIHGIYRSRKDLIEAYRFGRASLKQEHHPLLKSWRWQLRIWNQEEHKQFSEMMLQDWFRKQEKYDILRSKQCCPLSPRVIDLPVKEVLKLEAQKKNWKDYLPESYRR